MKRQIVLGISLLCGFFFTSCEEEVINNDSQLRDYEPMTSINANIEGEKTPQLRNAFIGTIGEDNKVFYKNQWAEGDSVLIVNVYSETEPYAQSIFSNKGQTNLNSFVFVDGTAPEVNTKCYAYYPCSLFDAATNRYMFKDTLRYESGKILPEGSWAMKAVSESNNFQFESLSSLLKIKIGKDIPNKKNTKISQIKLTAAGNNEYLSGAFSEDLQGIEGAAKDYIVLDCGEGVSTETDSIFNLPIPSGKYSGLFIDIEYTDYSSCRQAKYGIANAGFAFEPSKFYTTSFEYRKDYDNLPYILASYYQPKASDGMVCGLDNVKESTTAYFAKFPLQLSYKDGYYYISLEDLGKYCSVPLFTDELEYEYAIAFYLVHPSNAQEAIYHLTEKDWLTINNSTVSKYGEIDWVEKTTSNGGKVKINTTLSSKYGKYLKVYPSEMSCEIGQIE